MSDLAESLTMTREIADDVAELSKQLAEEVATTEAEIIAVMDEPIEIIIYSSLIHGDKEWITFQTEATVKEFLEGTIPGFAEWDSTPEGRMSKIRKLIQDERYQEYWSSDLEQESGLVNVDNILDISWKNYEDKKEEPFVIDGVTHTPDDPNCITCWSRYPIPHAFDDGLIHATWDGTVMHKVCDKCGGTEEDEGKEYKTPAQILDRKYKEEEEVGLAH